MKNNQLLTAIKLIVLLCLFVFNRTEAQSFDPVTTKKLIPSDIQISCGTDIRLQRLRQDPNYTAREDAMNRAISNALSSSSRLSADYTLPVVFHIISGSPFSVTDAQIQNALNDLNDAFSKQGVYAGGDGVDTKIQFCLANKDPDGGNTTGITRTTSFLTNFDMDIEDRRMKNLVQWDPSRFINIWYTTDIASEIMATFECGVWNRMKAGGYATLPPGGGTTDGIVVTGFGTLLAHEMGHYLGLYHTFEGLNCNNFDCATSGDRVCDTPPDRSVKNSPSCSSPENSCSTDTLSGFPTDVPDMISNFMDYGNNACHNAFTDGQAIRMRAAIATQRNGLLANQCDKPCAENIVAAFTRSNAYPLPGDIINFTNTTTGASVYQWTVDNTVVASTANFSHTFSAQGKYKVTLKAYNADAACYSTYTDYIIVNCGVMARFYPDKRLIASKENIQLDSIFFKNRSVNATSYRWMMSAPGIPEQEISTATDLKFVFLNPGGYTVRLIATNGTCTDTTERFSFSVQDPTADGELYINSLYCYQETKIRVSFFVCNNGYVTIPVNTPISFYDNDPRVTGAHKLNSTFFLPAAITGKCCGVLYTHTVDVGVPGLNKIYIVLNDSGNVIPIVLPGTKLVEKNYFNNIQVRTNFKFKVNATPPSITAERGDTLQLNATAGPNNTVSILWTPTENMSCVSCFNPKLIASKDTIEKVTAISQYGCSDSAFINIKVPPSDDYTITIDSIDCAANNKLHAGFTICNSFRRGSIPKNLSVSFYDSDPSLSTAHLLGPVFIVSDTVHSLCASFEHLFDGVTPGTKIYAVVNDNGTTIPLALPNQKSITEKNYLNNSISVLFQPSVIQIQPADTSIFRKTQAQFSINGIVYNPASVKWLPGNGYALSCENCLSPMVTAYDSSIIKMEAANKFGCIVKGEAKLNILPADMKVTILETSCISNGYTMVKFKLCMNNGYDSVFKNIPVSFYDGDPASGNAKLLPPLFLTPEVRAGDCAEYAQIIKSPLNNKLFAAVNDKGKPPFIDKSYPETNLTNNTASIAINPFVITVNPSDTAILRATSLQLEAFVTGEPLGSLKWEPAQYLSCNNCLTPVASPPSSMTYKVIARNERACTDTAYVTIKTFTAGDKVSIPNAFTPNRDGNNDVFYILGTNEVLMVRSFQIFDRWGQAIFKASNTAANDPNYGWKGTIAGGKDANSGTYVYVVAIEFKDGRTEVFKGTVILVR